MLSIRRTLSQSFFAVSVLTASLGLQAGCIVKPQVIEVPNAEPKLEDLVVVGYAQVQALPDRATLTVGVKERSDNPVVAMQAVEKKVRAMLSSLDGMGIPKANVTTDQMTLHEEYASKRARRRFFEEEGEEEGSKGKSPPKKYYEGVYTVEIVVDDLNKVGALVNTIQRDGVNDMSHIEFEMKEPEGYLNQARNLAVKNAIEQAKALADGAGYKIGKVERMATTWGDDSHRFGVPGGMVAGLLMEAESGTEIPIRPGKMTFESKVRVSFSFDPGS